MTYSTLNYYSHIILTNKYLFIIKISIFLGIYLLLYTNQIIYCMNDNPNIVDVPNVAESKEPIRPSHQIVALKNEIVSYAIPYAELQEQLDFYKQEVANLHEKNFHLERENERLRNEIDALETFPVNFH